MRILPPSTKPVTPNPLSALTVVEISETTAVGETIEVIELDAVQPESRPLQVRRASFAWAVRLWSELDLGPQTDEK
jgi:hypothetical protein